jgi:hypothetical protein
MLPILLYKNLLQKVTNYEVFSLFHFLFNKIYTLPHICAMSDTGFKVLSMKINYLSPFKHKHKHQKFAHEN